MSCVEQNGKNAETLRSAELGKLFSIQLLPPASNLCSTTLCVLSVSAFVLCFLLSERDPDGRTDLKFVLIHGRCGVSVVEVSHSEIQREIFDELVAERGI